MSQQRVRVKEEPKSKVVELKLKREHDSSSPCARVKEEAGGQTEGGASEVGARVKEEPVWTQDRDLSEVCPRAEEGDGECGVSAAAARAGLYAGHEVKGELVLGPERLQPPDSAFAIRVGPEKAEITTWQSSTNEEAFIWSPAEGPRPRASRGAQLRLRPCSVRLERLAAAEEPRASSTILRTSDQTPTHHDAEAERPPAAGAASEPYCCDTCGEQFARKRSLIRHIQLHSSGLDEMQNSKGINHLKHIKRRSSRLRKEISAKRSRCDKVGEESLKYDIGMDQFSQKGNENMYEQTQTEEKLYKCYICKKTFLRYRSLFIHKRKHKKGNPYECKICMKQFSNKYHLIVHERIHTGEKPFKCDICMKQFSHLNNLVIHNRVHTGEKPYKCDVCMKQFTRSDTLVIHKRTHTGERPYECDICFKLYRQSIALIAHKRSHTGERPYKCDICMKKFSRFGNLSAHKRIHTREKPYKCDRCMKEFSNHYAILQHKIIHTGEKRYKCDICMKQFSHKRYLYIHIMTHTKRTYTCDICSKKFSKKSKLRTHIRNHMRDSSHS